LTGHRGEVTAEVTDAPAGIFILRGVPANVFFDAGFADARATFV